jgi:hypothetical protein
MRSFFRTPGWRDYPRAPVAGVRKAPRHEIAGCGRQQWEVSRRDLDAELIRSVIERLNRTGKLVLQGGFAEDQLALFTENQGDDNCRAW